MEYQIHMPKLGMIMKEGTVVNWLKQEGETVNKGDKIAEIMSEKISNTIEAQETGVLSQIIVKEGETVGIGTVIAVISTSQKEVTQEEKREEKPKQGSEFEEPGKAVREIKALPPMRKIIGERMMGSLRKSPQGTLTAKADMSRLIGFKDAYKSEGKKVTFTDLFIKIAALALEENRILNSSIVDGKLIIYESANIGIGMAGDDTLYVPVIKNAQDKSISEISKEVKNLAQKVREGTISQEDTSGGTFTVSNLGMLTDIEIVTPIINPPQSAILAIGVMKKEVVVDENDNIVVRPMVTLSLTVDHTNIDAVPVANFLASIKKILKSPEEYII